MTICRLLTVLPSLSSMKPKFFMSRVVRAQPQTVMSLPSKACGSAKMPEMRCLSIVDTPFSYTMI